ncbi:MAG: cytochrome C oxidase assembly protein [Sulfitobacter sp.]
MSLKVEHEIHSRRRGRNLGVGLMLGAFVILVMVLTFVKITQTDFELPANQRSVATEGNS